MTNMTSKDFLKDDTENKLYRATSLLNAIHKVTESVLGVSVENLMTEKTEDIKINFYKRLNIIGVELVSSAYNLYKRQSTENRESMLKDIFFIKNMISLANKNYGMSDMNAELLTRGCLYLKDMIAEIKLPETNIIKTDSAEIEKEIESIKDKEIDLISRTSLSEVKKETVDKLVIKDMIKLQTGKTEKIISDDRKSSRRDQVLSLLSKDPISIKDISEKIVGCSEKTIQRELNTLVDAKKIVRIGEKRWSRYTLAR